MFLLRAISATAAMSTSFSEGFVGVSTHISYANDTWSFRMAMLSRLLIDVTYFGVLPDGLLEIGRIGAVGEESRFDIHSVRHLF